ncbi:MAG: glycoside hydrolase family 32 protein [Armatimonadetes bacterium]|nr:glycoside hydrolase family 32 protein [Armatimonadota bacterium]
MNDPDRPVYHFQPPKNWMNDPKPFFCRGEYHVFFQYNPDWPEINLMRWGHVVSRDLAHWTKLPNALTPDPGGPDKDGCWTGCAVEEGGVYHILYTGVHPQVQCLAVSRDMIAWEKYKDNPVISSPPEGFGDCWRTGSEDVDGTMFECPDFFPLEGRHVLLTSCGATHWHIGRYERHEFTMDTHGLTDGGNFYAAKTLLDGKGRRILWGWVTENRSQEEMQAAGWAGVLSLPRVLSIRKDGTLGISPARELQVLRGQEHASSISLQGNDMSVKTLASVQGSALEIIARFKPHGAKRVGLLLRWAPDMSEAQSVYADLENGLLVAGGGVGDATTRRAQTAFEVGKDEEIELHVFLDHSVTEVFANGRACLTARSYTTRADADRGGVFSIGPAECALQTWEMKLT